MIKGLVIGFSIAAPVGPIGILCIRRSLYESPLSGLLTGLGAATADALYGCIAGFGLTFISSLLIRQKLYLHIIGGVFLCYLGVNTLLRRPGSKKPDEKSQGLIMSYVSAVFLTLTNPMTILSFAAVFAGLGLTSAANGYRSAALLVSGVFLGSTFWWLKIGIYASLQPACPPLMGLSGFGLTYIFHQPPPSVTLGSHRTISGNTMHKNTASAWRMTKGITPRYMSQVDTSGGAAPFTKKMAYANGGVKKL